MESGAEVNVASKLIGIVEKHTEAVTELAIAKAIQT